MTIGDGVGIYGGLLSTALAFLQWRQTRPSLRLSAVPAHNGIGHQPEGRFVRVNVANHGSRTVFVRQAFIYLLMDWLTWPERAINFFRYRGDWRRSGCLSLPLPHGTVMEPALPCELAPGRSMIIWIPAEEYTGLRHGPRVEGVMVAVQDETDATMSTGPLTAFAPLALPNSRG